MSKTLKILSTIAGIMLLLVLAVFIISPEKYRITEAVRAASGSAFIRLSEGLTEYEVAGPEGGERVILVHGLSVPMYDWDYQFDMLADAGYRVLRYNQYGRALSGRPRGTYDARRYVGQLKDLMDAMGWKDADLVVHSMGGAVGVEFARARPEAVRRLVLVSPAFHLAEDNSGISLVRIPLLGGLMAKTVLPGVLADRADSLFYDSGAPEAEAFSAAFRNQIRYFGFSRSVKSLFRHDLVENLSDAYRELDGSRCLLIWGTADDSIPEAHIEEIRNLVPGLETVVLEGAGHSPNLEVPEEVKALLLDFLSMR